MTTRVHRGAWLVVACVLAVLLPFLDKAYTIDDPLFLWLAEQIQRAPLDPFGFEVNWYGYTQPMHVVTNNPPLTGYWIAAWASVVGWSEPALHATFLIPAVALALAVHGLALRWRVPATLAALVAVFTPAFVVSSTNVMCDTMLVAFWTLSLWAWWKGMDEERFSFLALGAALAGLAFLTKYSGLAILPLLVLASLVHGESGWRARIGRCAWLLLPLGMIVGYELWTEHLYGLGHFEQARRFAGATTERAAPSLALQTTIGLAFLGAIALPLSFLGLLGGRKRAGAVLACWALGAAIAFVVVPEAPVSETVQRALLTGSGLSSIVFALEVLVRRRDGFSAVTCAWILGIFVFAAYLNWVNNVRSNLPAAPAIGLLAGLVFADTRLSKGRLALGLVPGLVVALLVGYGDHVWTRNLREAARQLVADHGAGPRPLRFQGHWGLQYYLMRAGAVSLDVSRDGLEAGDLVVIPNKNTSIYSMPKGPAVRIRERIELPVEAIAHAFAPRLEASFYASLRGTLPFAFGQAGPDVLRVMEVRRPFGFGVDPPGGAR